MTSLKTNQHTTTNNNENNTESDTITTNKSVGYLNKYLKYFDNLLSLISFWGTIVLFIYTSPILPELGWPFYLDELVFFILLFLLIEFTVLKLRPIFIVAILVGSSYLIVEIILNIVQDATDKTKTTQTISLGNEAFLNKLLDKLSNNNAPLLQKIDSVQLQNETLQKRQKMLEQKIDSLTNSKEVFNNNK